MYREIKITKTGSPDSKELYKRLTKIRSEVSVTDLGTTIWAYGDMAQEEFDRIIVICEEYGDVDTD